jgi:hypothetical protein
MPLPTDPDGTVRCPICRKLFKAITNRHLQDKHGMTMAEFKAEFPTASVWSGLSRRLLEGNEHAKGHRHTAAFKARFRLAVAKPRPAEVAERIRASWRERMKDPKFAKAYRAKMVKVGKAVAKMGRRGERGRFVGE